MPTFGSPSSGDVDWAGWEAALIINYKQRASKHKVPPNDYDGKLPDEDICPIQKKSKSAQDMNLDDKTDCSLGLDHNLHVSGLPLTDGASPFSTRAAEVGEKKQKIAEVVAAATGLVVEDIKWGCLPRGILRKYSGRICRSILKSVLSIIDVDVINVEAGNKRGVINVEAGTKRECEYRKLFSKLISLVHVDNTSKDDAEFCKSDFLVNLKLQHEVMNFIADGKYVGAEDFVGLSEGDVAFLISSGIRPTATESTVGAWISAFFEEKLPKGMVELALKEMETFLPLKEDREMQLAMELSHWSREHVLDYLFVEACKGFMSEEFFKDLDEMLVGSNRASEDVLSCFAEMLYQGLHHLAQYKSCMLGFSEEGIIFPLTGYAFGHFSKDAIGAIQIANHERRRRGGRFIGSRDILFGLSCAGYLKNFDEMGLREWPEMPPYRFYRLAGELALQMGAKTAQIEHLVGAFLKIAGQHKQADEFLSNMYSEVEDESNGASVFTETYKEKGLLILESERASVFTDTYKEKGLLHNGKPICGYKALTSAIRKGLELPDNIRMEHRATGGGPYFRPMDLCI